MKIGWRTITRIKRFLCERQNALVKKKVKLKDISFEIKIGRFGDLLKEINENMFRISPISPDVLGDIFEIFLNNKKLSARLKSGLAKEQQRLYS